MAPLQESEKGVIVLKETEGHGGREGDFFFLFSYLSLFEDLVRLMKIRPACLAPPVKVVASFVTFPLCGISRLRRLYSSELNLKFGVCKDKKYIYIYKKVYNKIPIVNNS